jgi:ABC-type multidrug transport system fused ATPase/permease subunit
MTARQILPIASRAQVMLAARRLISRHRRQLALTLALHGLVAISGLVGPRLLGQLVEEIQRGTSRWTVDRTALTIAAFVVVQSVLMRFAIYSSARLGEAALAELREDFVERVLAIPLSTVERAGAGDLITRTTRDVGELSTTVRYAVPEILVAIVAVCLSIGALVFVGPLLALPCLVALPILWLGTKWYLRRAPAGYLRENAAYADLTEGLTETVEGARTIEALRLGERRRRRTDEDIAGSYAAEKYTLFLRTVFWPVTELSYVLPVVATLFIGGWFYTRGWVTLSQVTAATLYVQQLIGPLDQLLSWLDHLQVGAASLARLLGVADVADDRTVGGGRPENERLEARGVRYAYVDGRDVLHGIDLRVEPGERLAMVGPSGAGKSTLGRLLAGIHPPRTGSVTVGGMPLVELPLDELRGHVALVTQEHHVFVGTVRDNVLLARPGASEDDVRAALEAVDAQEWVAALPDGLDTLVGSGNHSLAPAQAQQLALARLVLADPHTLVLDEATSLIDPRTARHLERSLAAVLHGRTVIAIAHRLFSAHDADRVAVVEDGVVTELGSHHELIEADGAYAALWRSWHGTAERTPASATAP